MPRISGRIYNCLVQRQRDGLGQASESTGGPRRSPLISRLNSMRVRRWA